MGKKCRDLLEDIRKTTFLVDDHATMENILNQLKQSACGGIRKEQGLSLRPQKDEQTFFKENPKSNIKRKGVLLDLKHRKKKKAFSGRVSEMTNKLKEASNIKIPVKKVVVDVKSEADIVSDDINIVGETFCVNVNPIKVPINNNDVFVIEDDTEVSEGNTHRESITAGDMVSISSNHMLSDNLISCFQNYLKAEYPEINGLQDPVLEQTLNFKVNKSEPFLQLLHDNNLHWVAVSTYGCKAGL